MHFRAISAATVMSLAAGCMAIPPPVTVADPDDQYAMLVKPLVWQIGRTGKTIVVPAGFVTDYASIPPGVRLFLPTRGRYSRAAIVHDFLYWSQRCSREQADNLMLIGMKEADASALKRWAVHKGVRAGGSFAWDGNKADKAAGAIKIIPPEFQSQFGAASWPQMHASLRGQGVADGSYSPDRTYCALGNSEQVP